MAGLRSAARGNIRYLEQDSCVIGGVRFLGCCLWTDYRLYGNPEDAMADAERYLLDHRKIRMGQRLFSAQDALDLHLAAREWLTNALSSPFDGPTVVVTHHGCHPDSIHPRYADMSLNAAFVNDLPHLLQQATLWIHGHVHDSFDYRVGNTRVVVNPRGYARNLHNAASPMEIEWENPLFDGARVVEV